ncbi:diguanylate cyclase [Scytonema hofmannii PCC 7110]|uniref:Diguanylate cyclase n=2 Tax=Scytonema hofmannii TaxID=34078 RepID=A0A139XFX5_9CYAN|nr:diguanylate cyclase [Scytonema hofmannii PCC 7110]
MQFIPHGHCYLWIPNLVWLHGVSDSLIALAYYSISITLLYFAYKRQDLPFHWVFYLFSAFIVTCGTSHLMEVWTLWYPVYWLSGGVKAITATISLVTGVLLVPVMPQALALPNLTQLITANQELEHEIGERQRVEEALRESNERFRSAFDYAAIGMALTATDGRWLQVNRALCEITGYSKEELLSTTFQAITHPDDLDLSLNYGNQLLNGKVRYYNLEKRYIHKRGNVVWVLLSASLVRDFSGTPLYFIIQVLDITDRKVIEETLKQQACIFENISDGIIITDLSGNIVDCNAAAERMFGYARVRSLGTTQEVLHKSENSAVVTEKIIERTLDTGRWTGEMNFTRKDGTEGICEKVVVPLYNEQGQPTATIEVNRDITERKQTEAALKQANEQLSSWVKELEIRNNEIALLSQMSDFLQACMTNEEAYKVIAHFVQSLFPDMSGGVFIISPSKYLVEAVTTWGNSTLSSKKLFTSEECWGLRRGRAHFVESQCSGLQCTHMSEDWCGESLCVPMMAQGEALGMLYLTSQQEEQFTKSKQQLASRISEHIALALANLKLREALQQQSTRDPLTGLFNRRYLDEFLEREIYRAERKQYSVGIIMIDVDRFKDFNDLYGHEAGDTVLRELGIFLKQQIRQADIACRYGGEEFLIVLPETCLETCSERAEHIREGVKHLDLEYRHQSLSRISLSLGVALFPMHGLTPGAVIQAADSALYCAKQSGRDRVMTAFRKETATSDQ